MAIAGIWAIGPAGYYWAAAVAIFAGGIVHSLNRAGVIPGSDFFVHYTLNLGSVLEFIFLSIGVADTVRTERRQRTQLRRQLTTEVDAAELRGLSDERERVAAEIHDGVGNSLLNLRQSIRSMQPGDDATLALDKLERLVQDTYDEVRKIANNLLPAEFEQKGLDVALRELVDTLNYSNQTQFYLLMSGQEAELTPKVQFQLYLVIVELINNIIKHASATEASIRFAITDSRLLVNIRDNGVGLDPLPKAVAGRGWANVRQRLDRIGGSLHIDRKIDRGSEYRRVCSDQSSSPYLNAKWAMPTLDRTLSLVIRLARWELTVDSDTTNFSAIWLIDQSRGNEDHYFPFADGNGRKWLTLLVGWPHRLLRGHRQDMKPVPGYNTAG